MRRKRTLRDTYGTAAALVALLFLAGTDVAAAQGQDAFLPAIKAMKRSVVPVMCFRALPPQAKPVPQTSQPAATPPTPPQPNAAPQPPRQYEPIMDATGFFISSRGDFVTAAHAVADFQAGRRLADCTMAVWFESPIDVAGNYSAQAFFVSVADCVVDTALDVARCRTVDDLNKFADGRFAPEPVEIAGGQRDDGSAVAITGFPLFNTTPITSRGYIASYVPPASDAPRMVLDRAAWPGGSGSPVYDSRGRVLGMLLIAGEGTASGISYACTGDAILGFLRAHPVSTP